MDFNYLLELAKENEERTKKDNSVKFSTKIPNAKKLTKQGPKGDAIKKILEKKIEDKTKQEREFIDKRANLLALRAKDKKSKKRVNDMINRTKGASKAVLEEAKDLTTAKGEMQCDEDDYGYESAISQQIFNSLKDKYSEMPEDDRLKFNKTAKSDISDIKARVMNSLKQKQEEDLGIRKRQRKRKTTQEVDDFINDGDAYDDFKKDRRKKTEASSKSDKLKSEASSKSDKLKKMPVDLNVTNYKSDKYAQFKYNNKIKRENNVSSPENKKKISNSNHPMSFHELMKVASKKSSQHIPIENPLEKLEKLKEKKEKDLEENRPLTAKEKKEKEEDRLRRLRRMGKITPEKMKELTPNDKKIKKEGDKRRIDNKKENKLGNNSNIKSNYKPEDCKNTKNSLLYNQLTRKNSKSSNLKDTSKKQNMIRNMSPHHTQVPKLSSSSGPKGRIFSDEDEYDSEMDDFIDDGDAEVDYSSEISKLFNYDKSKYRYMNEDDDDASMEASYSQMQKEEKRSAKIGLMEDLEDIKREEAEKKRKKMMKAGRK